MIGETIKRYRRHNNLTLKELAQRTGLSVGYLSNVERDQTSPTFDNLCAICDALSISVEDLLRHRQTYNPCIKKKNRKPIYPKDYRFQYEYITGTHLPMVGICMTLPADYRGEEISNGHDTDEYGIVVKGALIFEIEGETFLLQDGDAIYVKARTLHKWRNVGEGECISYWTRINYIRTPSIKYHNRFENDLDGLDDSNDV